MAQRNGSIGHVSISPSPVRQQVADVLRQSIIDLVLKPGQRLVERELCEQTGVSRTSIREGLRELEAEGLVKNVPYKGLVVATVDRREAECIYEVRCQVEGLLGRSAAEKRSKAHLIQLNKSADRIKKAVARARYSDLIKLKAEFYRILMDITDNPILTDIITNLQGRVAQFRATVMTQPNRAKANIEEIDAIIRAIADKDMDAAERACVAHVRNAGDLVIMMLADAEKAE